MNLPGKNWMAVKGEGEDFLSDEYEGRGVRPVPVITHECASNRGNILGVKVDGGRSQRAATANRVRRRSVSV